jgi:hypothetical protein
MEMKQKGMESNRLILSLLLLSASLRLIFSSWRSWRLGGSKLSSFVLSVPSLVESSFPTPRGILAA